jgi:osmotically-inducible protein OsmY
VADRALAARVRAILKATPSSAHAELDVQASASHVRLAGVVGSESTRDAALAIVGGIAGVTEVSSEVKVFRRPVR